MKEYRDEAINSPYSSTSCADEIVHRISTLAENCMNARVKWNGAAVCWQLEEIVKILPYLAQNTRNYQKLSDEDMASLEKIFEELNELRSEVILRNSQFRCKDELSNKIGCISEILQKNKFGLHDSAVSEGNWRDGMLFQSYENLWKVIHRVNTEWEELWSRGFSVNVFIQYWLMFQSERGNGVEKSEKEKLKEFMELLDGKMRYVALPYKKQFARMRNR